MTAREAYEMDLTFRALVDTWVSERRCPLVLKDRALELDLLSAVACADWAATEPDRVVFVCVGPAEVERLGLATTPCGPFPSRGHSGVWYWYIHERELYQANSCHPDRLANRKQTDNYTPLDAVLWLLDNFKASA